MMLASDLTKQMLKPKEKEMAKLFYICGDKMNYFRA